MTLNRITHNGNRFCGPAAISTVVGIDTGHAAQVIRQFGNRRSVKGTTTTEMRSAFRSLGVDMVTGDCWFEHNERFDAWAKRTHEERGNNIYLVSAGHHWRVVQGWDYACGQRSEVTTIAHAPTPRSIVTGVYRLDTTKMNGGLVPKKKYKDPNATTRAKARRLAKKWRCTIEIEHLCVGDVQYWVDPPDDLLESILDVAECDGRICHCWTEVVEKLEAYIKCWEQQGIEATK